MKGLNEAVPVLARRQGEDGGEIEEKAEQLRSASRTSRWR
jgi:hypothetical protein